MAAKRARNSRGHYQQDDPSTPDVNEAYEQEEKPDPSLHAKRKKAQPKKASESAFKFFVSSDVENAAFDVRVGPDAVRVNGVWDENRAYVTWKCPTLLAEAFKLHHHVWSGRILAVED